MIRSMSSALSGLRNHQLMLDFVGNNIANVSTIGFKGSSAIFSDVLSQTLRGAGAPVADRGGTNPAQIGLGSQLAGTVQSFTQGALQRTGRSTDVAIQGDGFFVIRTPNEQLYTRAGSFTLDAAGNLTTPEGAFVLGWQATGDGQINTNGAPEPVRIPVGDLVPPVATSTIDLGGNLKADAVPKNGDDAFVTSLTVTIFDDQGTPTAVTVEFVKDPDNANAWSMSVMIPNPDYDPDVDDPEDAFTAILSDQPVTFNPDGSLLAPADGMFELDIDGQMIDMSLDGITQFAGSNTVTALDQNGSMAGSLQSFTVSQDGVIVGAYSNGRTRAIGQLALAVFANPEGLDRVGGAWRVSANSGLAQIGEAGAGGRGLLSAGTLEMSNVDLAEEFARLIVAQRGFQGNARVVSTADDVLQEVVNLRR